MNLRPKQADAPPPSSCPFSFFFCFSKFNLSVLLIGLLLALYFFWPAGPSQPLSSSLTHKTVTISQISDHIALNETYQGILESLEEAGYVPDKNLILKHESASGNLSTANTIATHFSSLKPDCMVGVSTPSAQSLARYNFPLIFTAVTDPVDAKLLKDLRKPGKNISGVACYVPEEPQLDLIQRILPKIKKIGILYNPSEINSVSMVNELKKMLPKRNLKLVEAIANNTSEVTTACLKLMHTVEAILLPQDNTVATAIVNVLENALKHKIPVFVSDKAFLSKGALAGCGYDWRELGRKTGELVVEVLNGRSPGDISVVNGRGTPSSMMQTWVNTTTAEALGISLPSSLLKESTDLSAPQKDQ